MGAMAKEMVTKLDAGEGDETGDFRVFTLKNAKAEELARVLLQALAPAGRDTPAVGTPVSSTEIGRASCRERV